MKKPILAAAILALTGLALADVQVQTFSRMTMFAGMGTVESNSKTAYQADKRAEIQDFRFVGGIVGTFSKGTQTKTEITRLDKDLIWELDPKAKTYTERPIAFPTDQELSGVKVESETSGSAPASRHRVTKSEIKVEKTGKTRDLNGFPCTEYLITWEVVLEDTATKDKVDQMMTVDMWTTPLTDALKKAKAAEDEFNSRLAKKMGAGVPPAEMNQLGAGMLTGTYGVDSKEAAANLEKVSKEMSKVEGYPIANEVTWKLKADSTAASKTAPQAKKEEPEPPPPPSLGGMSGFVANKIAKSVVKEPEKPQADVLFSSYTELKSVAVSAVPPEDFEIPAGYKKAEKTEK
jgi:hypothetical protein